MCKPDYMPISLDKERQDFIIDRIVDHDIATARNGSYKRIASLIFEVRWAGYNASEDTWHIYKSIPRVKTLDDYANDNMTFNRLYTKKRYMNLHKRKPSEISSFQHLAILCIFLLKNDPGRSVSSKPAPRTSTYT